MPGPRTAASTRTPLLARLKVGTKLMLLVLLPVCVLLAFTSLTAVADWRSANELRNFRTATQLSFATAGFADQLAAERTTAVLLRLRPGAQAEAGLVSAQREVNQALQQAEGSAAQQVRDEFLTDPRSAVAHTSLATWLDASGARIDGLRSLESGAASDLAASASRDLHAAQASGIRDLSLSLAVLAIVAALALALRWSITRPLSEVSEGARTLSSGDLAFDVSYAGRDEIGDVAAAFRDLHVTAERLVGEIRATNAAISDNQLDHRADISAFEGTWAQLLAGMNDTTAAFAKLHRRRRRAERELEGIFNLSLDLLCIAGKDGYFKRVNPAFERTLGYSSEELLAKPILDFVHPDDRGDTQEAHDGLVRGDEITQFENRYIRSDGAERWLQWSARSV
jgi:PAS domain S-box-containing protein